MLVYDLCYKVDILTEMLLQFFTETDKICKIKVLHYLYKLNFIHLELLRFFFFFTFSFVRYSRNYKTQHFGKWMFSSSGEEGNKNSVGSIKMK
jgi:hypothetical protein